MDKDTANILVDWFQILEQTVMDYLNFVSPINNNLEVFSPRLATVIMEACGIIDSILRHYSPNSCCCFNARVVRKNNYNISHYAALFASDLADIRIIHLQASPKYIHPFSTWLDVAKPSPSWWRVHNDLKHNRIKYENLQQATLKNALNSLAALLAVMSINEELIDAMVRKQWLQATGTSADKIHDSVGNPTQNTPFAFCTSLFALIIGKQLPENIEDFQPVEFECGTRIRNYFGYWYKY